MPHSGSSRIALACCVSTSVTRILNSSISWSPTLPPRSLASAFFSDPRWSIAAAAITPRSLETAFMPASLPGVIFTSPSNRGSFYYRELEVLHDRGGDGLVDDVANRQGFLGVQDIAAARLRGRVAWREQRAAVLVGDDRDGIRPENLRLRGDLFLVHADQRAQNGLGRHLVDRRHVFERLRRDL